MNILRYYTIFNKITGEKVSVKASRIDAELYVYFNPWCFWTYDEIVAPISLNTLKLIKSKLDTENADRK